MHKVVEHHTLRVDVVEKEVGTLCKLKDDEGYGCGERGRGRRGTEPLRAVTHLRNRTQE